MVVVVVEMKRGRIEDRVLGRGNIRVERKARIDMGNTSESQRTEVATSLQATRARSQLSQRKRPETPLAQDKTRQETKRSTERSYSIDHLDTGSSHLARNQDKNKTGRTTNRDHDAGLGVCLCLLGSEAIASSSGREARN